MKLSSLIAMRPICFFFTLAIVVLLIPTLVISIWCLMSKQVERSATVTSQYVQEQTLVDVRIATKWLYPINSSVVNLGRILSSSLSGPPPSLDILEAKVAPYLFMAFTTLPLAQVSYIGFNGVFYSYYTNGNQTFVTYADASSTPICERTQNVCVLPNCQTEAIDDETGKRLGKGKSFNSTISINCSWLQESYNSLNAYSSLGTTWGENHEQLLLSTTAINRVGLVSLGFPVKAIIDVISRLDLHGADMYLVTKDGTLLAQTGNMSIAINDNRVSVVHENPIGDLPRETINITCEPGNDPLIRKDAYIAGKKYVFYCATFAIAGLPSAYVMVFPHKGLVSLVLKDNKLPFFLLLLLLASVVLSISFFIFLIVRTARREMYLSASLIKQMDATQQAERKSMNKSIAFASASHDVRSSLAALDGLISLCCSEVDPKSELHMNLQQMRTFATDLIGLLNAVLDTSKIEAGKMQLIEEEFDLAQVLEESANFYYPVGNQKGIDVVLDPCDGSILKHSLVKGDRGKFKQILNNLIHNAIKFTLEGSISIRAWVKKPSLENKILDAPKNSDVWSCFSRLVYNKSEAYNDFSYDFQQHENSMEFVIEVDDTGKGIPKDKQKSVFENFVQVKGTALEHGGTGLGLGIVQSLVRLMGGEISIVDKESREKGTCFRFNVFFSACESESATFTEREDAKLLAEHIPPEPSNNQQSELNIMNQSPTSDGSHVILLIQGDERRKMLKRFLESQRIRVSILDGMRNLSPTLKRIRSKWYFNYSYSGKSDLGSSSDYSSVGVGTKDGSLSVKDGTNNTLPLSRKTSLKSNSRFVLIVIDFSGANFSNDQFVDLLSILDGFQKDTYETRFKVVWLYTPNPDIERRKADERKLAHCEIILSKPLHGSRLFQVLRLLPEFGGTITIQANRFIGPAFGSSSHVVSNSNHFKSNQPLEGKTILVAEDLHILRVVAKKLLDKLGATTECCENGEEAVKRVRKALYEVKRTADGASKIIPYDYIFMDCEMPIMNGYEATRQIRIEERPYGVRVPVIALTAHSEKEEEVKSKQAGMDYHLTKPLSVEKLMKAIHCIDNNESL